LGGEREAPRGRETDRDLVRRAVSPESPQGQELALRAIYDRYAADVLGLCGWFLSDPDAAMDAAQSTFEIAIKDLTSAGPSGMPTLRDPDQLGAWLRGIAKNQCRAVWKRRDREGEFPEQDLEDAEHEVKASRRRQAQVNRMLDTVGASLTGRQELIFQLVIREGIRGQALARRLGISEKEANDATYGNEHLLHDGFGALVLALDGRRHCDGLARILDHAAWDGQVFTRVLRLRILRHLDDCPKLCDNCGTCKEQKKRLIATYTPVTIPILITPGLRDQVYAFIHDICTPPRPAAPGQSSGSASGSNKDDQGDRPPAPDRRRRRRATVIAASALLLVGGTTAAAAALHSSAQTVAVTITVVTDVAAVSDIPGQPVACPGLQGLRTSCTKVLPVRKGQAREINVVLPAGASFALRYFGCDDNSPTGSSRCTITASGPRAICITTTDPRDQANVAECLRRTGSQ
jgi:RNA polymerase sigma factor (sigma-70 family)